MSKIFDFYFYIVRNNPSKWQSADYLYSGITFSELTRLYISKDIKPDDFYIAYSNQYNSPQFTAFGVVEFITQKRDDKSLHDPDIKGKVSDISHLINTFGREELQESTLARLAQVSSVLFFCGVLLSGLFCTFGGGERFQNEIDSILPVFKPPINGWASWHEDGPSETDLSQRFLKFCFGVNVSILSFTALTLFSLCVLTRLLYYVKFGRVRYGDRKILGSLDHSWHSFFIWFSISLYFIFATITHSRFYF